jgi:hypothetical protein
MTEIERVFVRFRGRTIGPLTPDKVRDMVRRGQLTRMHELSADGLTWTKAEEFGNFFPRVNTNVAGHFTDSASNVPPGSEGYVGGDSETVSPTPNENASAQWYAHVKGEKQGPISLDQIRLYAEAKVLKKDSLVWKSGMDAWKPAGETLPEVFAAKNSGGAEPDSVDGDNESRGSTVQSEFAQHHQIVMLTGVALVALAIAVVTSQIMEISGAGRRSTPIYLGAVSRIGFSIVALLAGSLAINTSLKMKSADESSSMIQTLLAVRALNQLWVVAGSAGLIMTVVMVAIVIAAIAMQLPVEDVLP